MNMPMTVMLYDALHEPNLDDYMDCKSESVWIVFGCLAYCDTCLPEHYRVIE